MRESDEDKFSKLSAKEGARREKNPVIAPQCLALIARDSLQDGPDRFNQRQRGFWPFFPEIAYEANRHDADVLMFSSSSHNESSLDELSRKHLFPRGTKHSTVILGVTRLDGEELVEDIEVWHQAHRSPSRLRQYFAKASHPRAQKESLIENLLRRRFGHTMLLLCGEVNIVKTQRGKGDIVDDLHFRSRLRDLGINLVLNPSHTYMHRYEMAFKRQAISRPGRYLISVWNRGDPKKGTESKVPWIAYRNGKNITAEIKEIPLPEQLRYGIRMGVIRL
ncbi:MAG TPA: hypothetical protein VKZ53_18105 [Candidatus Angelobacter sp.]|nr:hypothetical protein [Candidatus Angelobacter sp.]